MPLQPEHGSDRRFRLTMQWSVNEVPEGLGGVVAQSSGNCGFWIVAEMRDGLLLAVIKKNQAMLLGPLVVLEDLSG
jgi:hypothetical protein